MSRPPTALLPPKKDVAMLLLQGPSLFIHLDPRKPQVVVPAWFKKQPQLILQVGLNLANPIPDLNVDDEGISGTLSFSRSPFWCRVPWTSVYALVGEDGRGMLWPNDVPSEVAAQLHVRGASPPPQQQPRLRAVPNPESSVPSASAGGAPASEPQPPAPASPAAASPSRPAVTLVRSDERPGAEGRSGAEGRPDEASARTDEPSQVAAGSLTAEPAEATPPGARAPEGGAVAAPPTGQSADPAAAREQDQAGGERRLDAARVGGGEPVGAVREGADEVSRLSARRGRGQRKRPTGAIAEAAGQAAGPPKKLTKSSKKAVSKAAAPLAAERSNPLASGEPNAHGRGKRDKRGGTGPAAGRTSSASTPERNTDVTPTRVPFEPDAEPIRTSDPSRQGHPSAVPGASGSGASANPPVPATAGRPSSRPKRDLPPYLRVIK